MPDEISHILWTYLILKHPRLSNRKEFKGRKNAAATYFFSVFPDIGNLILIFLALWVISSNGLPMVFGHHAEGMYPEVYDVFMGSGKNIYYAFHSYVTMGLLLGLFYLIMRKIYLPVLFTGFHITLDILTHAEGNALKPFYPIFDFKINGLLNWGSWEFYVIEITLLIIYTVWLVRNWRKEKEKEKEGEKEKEKEKEGEKEMEK